MLTAISRKTEILEVKEGQKDCFRVNKNFIVNNTVF